MNGPLQLAKPLSKTQVSSDPCRSFLMAVQTTRRREAKERFSPSLVAAPRPLIRDSFASSEPEPIRKEKEGEDGGEERLSEVPKERGRSLIKNTAGGQFKEGNGRVRVRVSGTEGEGTRDDVCTQLCIQPRSTSLPRSHPSFPSRASHPRALEAGGGGDGKDRSRSLSPLPCPNEPFTLRDSSSKNRPRRIQ